jgi:hypothetical protein
MHRAGADDLATVGEEVNGEAEQALAALCPEDGLVLGSLSQPQKEVPARPRP